MRNSRSLPLTFISTALLSVIMFGISSSALLYIMTVISIVFLARKNTIHFLILMLFSEIAYIELGQPHTDAFGFNFYVSDIFILSCIVYMIISIFNSGISNYSKSVKISFRFFIFLFFIGVLQGLINGVELRNLMRDISNFGGYMTIPIALNAFKTKLQVKGFSRLIIKIGILMALLGISMRVLGIENLAGFPGSAGVGTSFGRFSRAYGLSGGTSFMVATLFLLVSSYGASFKTHLRELAGIAITFSQILLLFARSLFLGIASGFAVLFLTSGVRSTLLTIFVAILALMVIYIVSELMYEDDYVFAITDRYLSIVSNRFGDEAALANIARRENEFVGVWNSLPWSEKIFGLGIGSRIEVTVGEYQELSSYHNSYATCIKEIGMLGVIAFILFIFATIKEAIRIRRFSGNDRDLYRNAIGFISTFIALAIWGSGTMGMPLNANVLACISLGIALRIFLLIQKRGARDNV